MWRQNQIANKKSLPDAILKAELRRKAYTISRMMLLLSGKCCTLEEGTFTSELFTASLIESLPNLIKAIIALFIIVDPFGNMPIFIGLTENMTSQERKRVFNSATITGFILLLVFALAGQQILAFFSISIYSFMIAGGILLLIMAIKLLIEDEWEKPTEAPEKLSAVPIAVPLLVGPGAITTTMLNFQEFGIIITVAAVAIVFLIVWLLLKTIDPIHRFMGKTGAAIITRIMALLIAAIAIQYIINGITYYVPTA
ncbi:MAG: MarC family protein [Candidatus Bathyarchaeota archaeon]|nr:MarC family protein [Candidatus Bathyarchaeota archaeon]